jgi:hypothetical protein
VIAGTGGSDAGPLTVDFAELLAADLAAGIPFDLSGAPFTPFLGGGAEAPGDFDLEEDFDADLDAFLALATGDLHGTLTTNPRGRGMRRSGKGL